MGSPCIGCHDCKYKCDHMGRMNLKTMTVRWPVDESESEVEVVEDWKEKKRKAESPPPKKARAKVKVEKVAKVKVKKTRVGGSKPKPTGQGAPKSSAVVEDSNEEENVEMVEDEVESEWEAPKPKRAWVSKSQSAFFIYFVIY